MLHKTLEDRNVTAMAIGAYVASRKGDDAFREGQPKAANPYRQTGRRMGWDEGWERARKREERRQLAETIKRVGKIQAEFAREVEAFAALRPEQEEEQPHGH